MHRHRAVTFGALVVAILQACPWTRQVAFLSWHKPAARLKGTARRGVPLVLADGAEQLPKEDPATSPTTAGTPEFEVVLPSQEDVGPLSELLMDSFANVTETFLLAEIPWGPIAWAWNSVVITFNREVIFSALIQSLQRVMSIASVRRPRGREFEGHGLGLMLVPRGRPNGPPAAFCELVLMPADGRKPDDLEEVLAMAAFKDLDDDAQPYLLNFCVAPNLQRRGLGRALLQLVESVVRDVWGDKKIYLHTEGSDAALSLYRKYGYEEIVGEKVKSNTDDKSVYMCKVLVPSDETPEV